MKKTEKIINISFIFSIYFFSKCSWEFKMASIEYQPQTAISIGYQNQVFFFVNNSTLSII